MNVVWNMTVALVASWNKEGRRWQLRPIRHAFRDTAVLYFALMDVL